MLALGHKSVFVFMQVFTSYVCRIQQAMSHENVLVSEQEQLHPLYPGGMCTLCWVDWSFVERFGT